MIPNLTFSLWTLPASQSAVPQMDLIPLQKTCIVLNNNASLLLMKCSKSFTQNQIFFYAEVGWWFLLFWCNSLTDLNFSSCAGKFLSLQQGTSLSRILSSHRVTLFCLQSLITHFPEKTTSILCLWFSCLCQMQNCIDLFFPSRTFQLFCMTKQNPGEAVPSVPDNVNVLMHFPM